MPTKDDLTYPVSLTPPDISAYRAGNIGVEYVHQFDSGNPGPHVMISAVVHGYEQFGFIPMQDNKQQLFLAMNGLQQAYQTIS